MTVRLCGRRVEQDLPGRQGRLLFAYLAAHRQRLVGRSELLDVLWPDEPPGAAESGLAALLAKLRRALGGRTLEGKHEIRLVLPARGDVAEALSVYERLRGVLREELGASPGPLVQALHRQLLRGGDPSAAADSRNGSS